MRTRALVVWAIALLCIMSQGCFGIGFRAVRGNGSMESEVRDLSSFSQVRVATFGTLEIEHGREESLRVEAEENLIPYFTSEVQGDTLVIGTRPGSSLRTNRSVRFYLAVRDLDGVQIDGSCNVIVDRIDDARRASVIVRGSGDVDIGEIKVDTLDLTVDGSGDVSIDRIDVEDTKVGINGSGHIRIDGGETREQSIVINGSGDYRAERVNSESVAVTSNGSGDVQVAASENLRVRINGSGDVRYSGRPEINQRIRGSGDLIAIR